MILLDTNVLIYTSKPASPFHDWAVGIVTHAVMGEGAVVNPIILAEWCVGERDVKTAADWVLGYGVKIVPLPVETAPIAALAYRAYRNNRASAGAKVSAIIPLPDFFIGAHAELMQWKLATVDRGRYETYFPDVELLAL